MTHLRKIRFHVYTIKVLRVRQCVALYNMQGFIFRQLIVIRAVIAPSLTTWAIDPVVVSSNISSSIDYSRRQIALCRKTRLNTTVIVSLSGA